MRKDPYSKVSDLLSREEFEEKVRKKMLDWNNLIDQDAATLLVLDELGRNEVEYDKISEATEGLEVTLRAKVESISPIREFLRKDGSQGSVVNLEISDGTGRCRLVLWDEDVELTRKGRISPGDTVRIIDGYVKRTDFGIEISKGRWGTILPEK